MQIVFQILKLLTFNTLH